MEKKTSQDGVVKNLFGIDKGSQSKEEGKKVGTQWENVIMDRVINDRTSQMKIQ